MHYLWFDTETGGVDSKAHSLLTAYFAICNTDLEIVDDLYLQLKPSNIEDLVVTEGAMKVNLIDLDGHLSDPNTVTYEVGKKTLMAFLNKHKIPRKRKSFMPAGHNIAFDKDFIFDNLVTKEEFESIVHYRTLCTSSVATFLKDVGMLPEHLGTLSSLAEYFGISTKDAHNAKGDILMNIGVYKEIKKIMNTHKFNVMKTTTDNSSILKIIEER